ncbi:N-acetylmuramic acid 6-phosphate etherase [Wenxinia saemankumensis]|uniref:N-acetylmuramic acid 6-phosphate etherase n=1 Tax=Wenxinia saemankumensis TaxID=1447782 RepID=A0A1M6A315_9RHOB|nr:N-acetylmuramic acid 6-phosphate etherase [Wenxinia saemankumensis]SHI30719.1 N-acetylmuramic acid 6-phosphate etherase [Wenxinia saemankumensis]
MTSTESAARRYRGIEGWPTEDLVGAMVEAQMAAVAALGPASGALARAVDAAAERIGRGGRLLYLGAGTSGRLATLDAAELPPTYGFPAERARAFIAGGARAITHAVEGAEDDGAAGIAALTGAGMGPDDVVIGVAASGRTPFVVEAVRHARAAGVLTVAVLNNPAGALAEAAEIPIVAATGAEIVAGSTRMKAGTAQKAALTCLSTGIFVRLGYVWRGRMVEMGPTNDKLRERAERMVADLADVHPEEAREALARAHGSIKVALVTLEKGCDPAEAQRLLDEAGGRLPSVLGA